MPNPFVHCELASTDLPKAKAFYEAMFDWQLTERDMGNGMLYTMIDPGKTEMGGAGGGMFAAFPGQPSAWMPYVLVADIHAATEKAKSLGAAIMRDVTEVPDAGWLSIFTDPAGAMLGLWQQK